MAAICHFDTFGRCNLYVQRGSGCIHGLAATVLRVIPLYNGTHLCRGALEFVLNQMNPADEVLRTTRPLDAHSSLG